MTADVVKNVLDKLGSEIVTPSCGSTIMDIVQAVDLVQTVDLVKSPVNVKPLSSYIEFRLDSSMQVDLTTCYSYLSVSHMSFSNMSVSNMPINNVQFNAGDGSTAMTAQLTDSILEPALESVLEPVLERVKSLPDSSRPQLFWFEYDNCQNGATAPGIHLSLNKFVRCDDPWSLNKDDTVTTALQYIDILCGNENTERLNTEHLNIDGLNTELLNTKFLNINTLRTKAQFIFETIATFGCVLHVSRLVRNDVETIKLHLVLRVSQVIDLLNQLDWCGSITGVTQLLMELVDNGCVSQLVFLDLSVTEQGIEPCLGIYVADKLFAAEQKTTFYRAMQDYLLNVTALPDKVNRLFTAIPMPSESANVWCDFKFFIDQDAQVSHKAYLGIKGDSKHPLAAIRSALLLLINR
jgi:hypothetical protein